MNSPNNYNIQTELRFFNRTEPNSFRTRSEFFSPKKKTETEPQKNLFHTSLAPSFTMFTTVIKRTPKKCCNSKTDTEREGKFKTTSESDVTLTHVDHHIFCVQLSFGYSLRGISASHSTHYRSFRGRFYG